MNLTGRLRKNVVWPRFTGAGLWNGGAVPYAAPGCFEGTDGGIHIGVYGGWHLFLPCYDCGSVSMRFYIQDGGIHLLALCDDGFISSCHMPEKILLLF